MKKIALVGYTGFVGSNIYASAGNEITDVYNSKNIEQAYGTNPDLLIYAGLRAEKYLANNAPEKDMELICQAEKNITEINPKRLVLISTIDVIKNPKGFTEENSIDTENLQAYGYNRYMLEIWVREHYPDALIIRLPGLFGINIKKNFIYDYIHVIPFMLKLQKLQELSEKEPRLPDFYEDQGNGFFKVRFLAEDKREELKKIFHELGFSALNFTDSRSVYQFYPLQRLWSDIQTALGANIRLLHPATEPISAGELYQFLTGETFVNELQGVPADYDYRTVHADLFGGINGYICGKETVLEEIRQFINHSN